mgnify:FL=1
MVRQLVRKAKDCDHLLGSFVDEDAFNLLIDEDCDLYAETPDGVLDETNIIFKFRKNVFSSEEQKGAYEGLEKAATASQNRGLAAGPKGESLGNRDWVTAFQAEMLDILQTRSGNEYVDVVKECVEKYRDKEPEIDTRGNVWLRNSIVKEGYDYTDFFEVWLSEVLKLPIPEQNSKAKQVAKNLISQTTYAAPVLSGIAGYFDRYPRIPYGRATSYTENYSELFEKSFPYLQKLDKVFREELPNRWTAQSKSANQLDDRFRVADTVFTTITVNRNFRTACHRDAGDLSEGFSNISAISNGKDWEGGYFVLPEFEIGINLRPGDLLLVNNHEGMHGNTELKGEDPERISVVAYFREKMLDLKSWDYEQLRRKFVDSRRLDESHPEWRPLWNGISAGMWDSDEWYNYLKANNMTDEDGRVGERATLEDFFA